MLWILLESNYIVRRPVELEMAIDEGFTFSCAGKANHDCTLVVMHAAEGTQDLIAIGDEIAWTDEFLQRYQRTRRLAVKSWLGQDFW